MSADVAAGWALSRSHWVSVVPMIQCRPHGMTKRTDFSVRRMMPEREWIRSRGHDEVDALGGPDVELAALADHRLGVVGPDAGALTTWRAWTSNSRPVILSSARIPVTRSPWRRNPIAATRDGDVRAVGRRRARELHGVPRVVDLGVVVLDGAGQLGLLQRRGDPQRGPSAQVLVPRQAAVVAGGPRQAVVEREPAST
jgi:hypothetical protein